jgi:hypothetical protein
MCLIVVYVPDAGIFRCFLAASISDYILFGFGERAGWGNLVEIRLQFQIETQFKPTSMYLT